MDHDIPIHIRTKTCYISHISKLLVIYPNMSHEINMFPGQIRELYIIIYPTHGNIVGIMSQYLPINISSMIYG